MPRKVIKEASTQKYIGKTPLLPNTPESNLDNKLKQIQRFQNYYKESDLKFFNLLIIIKPKIVIKI